MTGSRSGLRAAILVTCLALGAVGLRADEATKPPAATTEFTVGIGAQAWSLDGNQRRFEQYITPPRGLYLPEAFWQRLDVGDGPSFAISLHDLGASGPSADMWFDWAGLNLDSQYRRSHYFFDFDPASGANRRYDYAVHLEPDAAANQSYSFDLSTREVALRGLPSSGVMDWRSHQDGAAFGLRAGGYWLGLNYQREDFDVSEPNTLSGQTQSYGLSFSPRPGDRTQVSGYATWHQTDLDNFSRDLRSWDGMLTLLRPMNDKLTLTGQIQHFAIDETIILNAYARQQTSGTLGAEYRPWPGTTVTASWQNSLTDYVDDIQANVLGVGSNAVRLGIRSRVGRSLKLTGRYSRYDTDHRPLYYHTDLTLGDSLIYSTLTRLDLSATYAPPGPWGVSGQWQRHTWENDAQAIDNAIETSLLTGWWQTDSSKLSLTASLMHQLYHLPLVDIATGLGFASRADSAVLGATYALSDNNSVYATYSRALANGATADRYWRLGLGFNHEVSSRDRLRLEVNLGDFVDDNDPTLGVGADLYRLEWRRKL